MQILLVALGGILGSLLRWQLIEVLPTLSFGVFLVNQLGVFVAGYVAFRMKTRILIVNVIGSFILGYSQNNYFVMGFCGAFTTWSAFMLDVDRNLPFRRRTVLNIVLTFGLSIAAVAAGFALAS